MVVNQPNWLICGGVKSVTIGNYNNEEASDE